VVLGAGVHLRHGSGRRRVGQHLAIPLPGRRVRGRRVHPRLHRGHDGCLPAPDVPRGGGGSPGTGQHGAHLPAGPAHRCLVRLVRRRSHRGDHQLLPRGRLQADFSRRRASITWPSGSGPWARNTTSATTWRGGAPSVTSVRPRGIRTGGGRSSCRSSRTSPTCRATTTNSATGSASRTRCSMLVAPATRADPRPPEAHCTLTLDSPRNAGTDQLAGPTTARSVVADGAGSGSVTAWCVGGRGWPRPESRGRRW
jgi:hypothetical protein